jgi:hypothetical protein
MLKRKIKIRIFPMLFFCFANVATTFFKIYGNDILVPRGLLYHFISKNARLLQNTAARFT